MNEYLLARFFYSNYPRHQLGKTIWDIVLSLSPSLSLNMVRPLSFFLLCHLTESSPVNSSRCRGGGKERARKEEEEEEEERAIVIDDDDDSGGSFPGCHVAIYLGCCPGMVGRGTGVMRPPFIGGRGCACPVDPGVGVLEPLC